VLFVLPWLDTSPVRSGKFRPIFKWLILALFLDCLVLGYVGANRPDTVVMGLAITTIGWWATLWYFFHFVILLPVIGKFERPLPLPTSISEAVLAGKGA
jgi:ubiquinol-cytochrome c reductase cytochrome b subunit